MGQRISRLLHSCSVNLKSTRPGWSVRVALCIVMLVCSAGANFPCKPEQIRWNNTSVGKPSYECLNCPRCPSGLQPSVPCGTTIKNWTDVHCVSCELGETYSDKYDKAQCKACTICSTGKAVIKNCTLSSNRRCSKCKQGYYYVPFFFSCKLCSECCGDKNDEVARECKNLKHKCKVRSTPCMETTTPGEDTVSTVPTTHMTVPMKSNMTTTRVNEEEKHVPNDEPSMNESSMKPTSGIDEDAQTEKGKASGNKTSTNEALIYVVLILFVAVVLVALVLFIRKKCDKARDIQRNSDELIPKNSVNNIAQGEAPSESNQSASESSGSASPLLVRAESSQNNPSTLHGCKGLLSALPNDSPIPQSRGSSLPPSVELSELSLPSLSESISVSHPTKTESSQSESTRPREPSLPLHNRAESSQKNGNALPQTGGSAVGPYANRSQESSQSDRYTPCLLTSGCVSSQPDGPESSHSNQCESAQLNPRFVQPLPSRYQSPQCSGCGSPQPIGSDWSTQNPYQVKPGDMTLEKLEENHLEAFDLMCKQLDTRIGSARWDFEKLASCYNIPLTTRNSLKNEFQSQNGSPSHTLMAHLKVKHPDLRLRHLIKNLQSIGRKDIAQGLMPYAVQNVDGSLM